MFTKKTILIVGVLLLILTTLITLSLSVKYRYASFRFGENIFAYTAIPLQKAASASVRLARNIWTDYFDLVSVAIENKNLKKELNKALATNNNLYETKLAYQRLQQLFDFEKKHENVPLIVAGIVGKDPSPWFKTIMIDKGSNDGIEKGMPVIVPEGIVGQITDVFSNYCRALLIIEQNSAVDAIVQRTRARGIVKGKGLQKECALEYVLRKHDIKEGDIVISSGMDAIFPKGLMIGVVSKVTKHNSEVFQKVDISCYVDFEKLEEVFIIGKTRD